MSGLRVLTFDSHEAYVYDFARTGYEMDVVCDLPGHHVRGWDARMRPVPPNVRIVGIEEARANGNRYDCIVGHTITDLLAVKTIEGPRRVLVLHSSLDGRIEQERVAIDRDALREAIGRYLELVRGTLVVISEAKAATWQLPATIIRGAVDVSEYGPYDGARASGLRVANLVTAKSRYLRWPFHEAIFADDLPCTLVGANPDRPGIAPARDWNELKRLYREHRFFVHTAEPGLEDGYNLATLEAMASGMPVIGNHHPTSPVEDGVSGFLSDDAGTLRSAVHRLLEDRDLAAAMGVAARERVARDFAMEDFVAAWRRLLEAGWLTQKERAVLVQSFPPSKQGVGQAIFGVGAMVGPSLGPTLGGFITDNYSWHWCFLINVPLGIAAATMVAANLEDPPELAGGHAGRVDWPGIVFLVVGVGALQWLLERGNKTDWFASDANIAIALAAALGIGGLLVHELTTDDPVIDFRILKNRQLALGCVLGGVTTMGLFGLIFLFPVYTQSLLGWTAWQSGLGILPGSVATAVTMLVIGRLVWHVGPRPIFVAGMLLMPFTLVAMSQWTLESGWADILPPQILRGVTMGFLFIPLSTVALRGLPDSQIAKGSGMFNLFRQLGGSFGISILATILDDRADVHRSELSRHVGPFDPAVATHLDRLVTRMQDAGLDAEQAGFVASAFVDRMIAAQASMEAFYDAYFFLGVVFVLALPAGFLVARHAPGKLAPIE